MTTSLFGLPLTRWEDRKYFRHADAGRQETSHFRVIGTAGPELEPAGASRAGPRGQLSLRRVCADNPRSSRRAMRR